MSERAGGRAGERASERAGARAGGQARSQAGGRAGERAGFPSLKNNDFPQDIFRFLKIGDVALQAFRF